MPPLHHRQHCFFAVLLLCVLLLSQPLLSQGKRRAAPNSNPELSAPSRHQVSPLTASCTARCAQYVAPHSAPSGDSPSPSVSGGASPDTAAAAALSGRGGSEPLHGLAASTEPTPLVRQQKYEKNDFVDHYVACSKWIGVDPKPDLGNICELSFFKTFKSVCVPACVAGAAYERPTIPVCTGLGSQVKLRACEGGFNAAIDQTLALLASSAKEEGGDDFEREQHFSSAANKIKKKAVESVEPKEENRQAADGHIGRRRLQDVAAASVEDESSSGSGEVRDSDTIASEESRDALRDALSASEQAVARRAEATAEGGSVTGGGEVHFFAKVYFAPTSSEVDMPVLFGETTNDAVYKMCVKHFMRWETLESSVPKEERIEECARDILSELFFERPDLFNKR